MWIADGWQDYELLDCGGGEKLERWGGKAGEETEALARKARFSQHTLTPQERSLVLRQLRGEIARLKQAAPAWRRLLLWLMFPVGSARRAG